MQDLISIGIIAPISATFKHSADFFKLTRQYISEALPKEIYKKPSLVSDKEGNDILNRIIGGLVDSDIVVVDMTDKNLNVMLELGMRAAFDLPFVLIQLDGQKYPSDFKMQDIVSIPNTDEESTINSFKARLLEKVNQAADHLNEDEFSPFLSQYTRYHAKLLPTNSDELNTTLTAFQTRLSRLEQQVELVPTRKEARQYASDISAARIDRYDGYLRANGIIEPETLPNFNL